MGIQIFKGADTELAFENFKNKRTGATITGATVSVDIYEKGGSKLGQTVSLPEDGSTGNYYGTVADTHADLVEGQRIVCHLTANGGDGQMCYKTADGTVLVKRQR